MLRVHKTQVTSSVLFNLVVVVLAPVVFVIVLDESCLRYYLQFSTDLASLMQAWGIAQQGWEAYRPGFCSRRLLSEFSYVWLIYTLIQGLFGPSVALLKAHPTIERWLVWIETSCSREELDDRARTLDLASSSQQTLASTLTLFVVAASFGTMVPLLLLVVPLVAWLQCCTLDLTDRYPDHTNPNRFAVGLATRWLVQVPVRRMLLLSLMTVWTVTCLILVDLSFNLAPALFYVAFCAVVLGLRLVCHSRLPQWWRGAANRELNGQAARTVKFSLHPYAVVAHQPCAEPHAVPNAISFVRF
eukprot:TRINITY_DN21526_c0_g1_i1.p1 TRINITY_DN21526_c0_g1~~TRINITY_DN21526_c0_g1_i1.p1  ORF type:complete len:301 (-),score=57.28 TRINITY_DN21526_c0_g1_i1:419-1321(-)